MCFTVCFTCVFIKPTDWLRWSYGWVAGWKHSRLFFQKHISAFFPHVLVKHWNAKGFFLSRSMCFWCVSLCVSHFYSVQSLYHLIVINYSPRYQLCMSNKGQRSCVLHFVTYRISILTGPLASTAIKNVGLRVTMFIGGCIAAGGLLIASFATNIYIIIVSFGFITGICFMHLSWTPFGYMRFFSKAIDSIGHG